MIIYSKLDMLIPIFVHFVIECEDIPHLFWSCRGTLNFWSDVQSTVFKKQVNLTLKDIILGILELENHVFNFVILHGKQYIFNARTSKQPLDITAFKRILKDIYSLEKTYCHKE